MMSHLDSQRREREIRWPRLPLSAWKDTAATLHMWMQIVGKIKLALSAPVNHWWNVAFYVTSRGLTTSLVPYGSRAFQITFDFIDHQLLIQTAEGGTRVMALAPKSVAHFYQELMELLGSLGIDVKITTLPCEVPEPVSFTKDFSHVSYARDDVQRFWDILVQADRLMKIFRSEFIGKCSPVHFFWGSFDMAVTRFSGRRAPPWPGADEITREAYSHEVSSCGFWPGGGNVEGAAFYSYMAPEPEGFKTASIHPGSAFYNEATKGYILNYDDVRQAKDPDAMVLDFFHTTYDAGANLAKWDRAILERTFGQLKTSVAS